MKFVASPPSQVVEPNREPPAMFCRAPVSWPPGHRLDPVFLCEHAVDGSRDVLFLFAARCELDVAQWAMPELPTVPPGSYFMTFQVVRVTEGRQRVHVLTQYDSVPYAEAGSAIGYVPAIARNRRVLSGALGPRWVSVSAATWPTDAGEPMTFLMDFDIPSGEAVVRLAGAGRVYWFARNDFTRFAVVEQATDQQTIEQHHEDEECRGLW